MIKTSDTSKTIDRELSLSFEGVGRNKTTVFLKLFVLKTGLNFRVFLRFDLESREKAVELILFFIWSVHKFLAAV